MPLLTPNQQHQSTEGNMITWEADIKIVTVVKSKVL